MSFDPHFWGWPQWTIAILWTISLIVSASTHGSPKVAKDGEPERHNFFVAVMRVAVWTFCLIGGGFFGSHP